MSNKEFITSLACFKRSILLGNSLFDFIISYDSRDRIFKGDFSNLKAYIYSNSRKCIVFDLSFSVLPRKIVNHHLFYHNIEDMKFTPDELIRWSPCVYIPCSNYFMWSKYLSVSMDIYCDNNSRVK